MASQRNQHCVNCIGTLAFPICTPPPIAQRSTVMTVSVCLSVRYHISGIAVSIVIKFLAHVSDQRCPWLGPPLLALRYVMYFRFIDDVMFAGDIHAWLPGFVVTCSCRQNVQLSSCDLCCSNCTVCSYSRQRQRDAAWICRKFIMLPLNTAVQQLIGC